MIPIWIIPPPLRSNGPHCVKCRDKMGELQLNLAPGEPLALMKELPNLHNSIELDTLLASALDL